MAKDKGKSKQPQVQATPKGGIDPNAAKSAYDRSRKRLLAITAAEVGKPTVDCNAAAVAARALVRRAKKGETKARLALLPAELFHPSTVDRLEEEALALFYAHGKANALRGTSSRAKLPADLVARATMQRARMLRLATYHFDDDRDLGPEIARIRVGTGYADLAHDLSDLADVYEAKLEEVQADPKYFDGDEQTARTTSAEILDQLGLTTDQGWVGAEARAFAALKKDYEELAGAIAFVERKVDGASPVPTLVQAADPERGARIKKGHDAKPASPATPAPAK